MIKLTFNNRESSCSAIQLSLRTCFFVRKLSHRRSEFVADKWRTLRLQMNPHFSVKTYCNWWTLYFSWIKLTSKEWQGLRANYYEQNRDKLLRIPQQFSRFLETKEICKIVEWSFLNWRDGERFSCCFFFRFEHFFKFRQPPCNISL